MKRLYIIGILLFGSVSFAQDGPFSGEYRFNTDGVECLPQQQRLQIKQRLSQNVASLKQAGKIPDRMPDGGHVLFDWPVVKNPESPYNNVWSISNHVDHNMAFPNNIQDYNCGSRTYDSSSGYNHAGVDIFTWPFSWFQMQNNQSWAVAAANGIIIGKDNGNSDQSCNFNNNNWNAVYLLHEDGSVSWYGHLKNNSLTSKPVGDSVESGEYLGVIGSSGNSTGPHLHFEIYDAQDNLVDAYQGTCNTWGDSWWNTQKPYVDPKINAVFTHSAPPAFPNCPQLEIPNFRDQFNIGEIVYGVGYFSDQAVGANVFINLNRPDGTLAYTSSATANSFLYASYWYWSFNPAVFNQVGTWTVSFTFGGQTVSHQFAYGTDLLTDENQAISALSFYPNPGNEQITFNREITSVTAFSADGRGIPLTLQGWSANISTLPTGLYILKAVSDEAEVALKLVKL